MHHIIIQRIADGKDVPKSALLRKWAKVALNQERTSSEVTIRIVDKEEMAVLNSTYRHKKGPTNVLSFPFTLPKGVEMKVPILGDIVICAEIVNQEAKEQRKTQEAHWAHMIVHGIFHLFGYDHVKDDEAKVMEAMEIAILKTLGFSNPYEI